MIFLVALLVCNTGYAFSSEDSDPRSFEGPTSMEKAAQDIGFKHSDISYSPVYTKIVGVGLVFLFGAAAFVFVGKRKSLRTTVPGGEMKGKKIVTLESTQLAYDMRAILLEVNGREVLVVQTKDSHSITELSKSE